MSRHARWLLALLASVALVAAACGNSGDDDDGAEADVGEEEATDDGGEATETTEATDTTEAPDEGGEADGGGAAGGAATGAVDFELPTEFVPIEGVPGVSDEEIAVGVIGTKAGNPLGTCILDCYTTGIQAYFDWINDRGGIYGRELVIGEVLDDELVQNQVRSLDLIASEDSFAAFSATLVASGWGDLNDAGVPTFAWNIHATESAGRQNVFGHLASLCADCTQRGTPYMAELAGATKAGLLGYGVSENSKVCTGSLRDSFELYFDDIGVEVAYFNDELAFGLPDGIGPQVTEMIDAGVDFVATCMDLNGMKTLAQEFERQGYRDQVVMQHPNTYDQGFVAEAGGLFDGDYVAPQFAALEFDGVPAFDLFEEWVAANGGPVAEQTMIGWINAHTLVTGLIEAGPEFDRQKVIDGLNALEGYTAMGLTNPIDWARQHDAPTEGDLTHDYLLECASIVQMEGEGFVPVGEPDMPFVCWDNADPAWVEPEPTNFAVTG